MVPEVCILGEDPALAIALEQTLDENTATVMLVHTVEHAIRRLRGHRSHLLLIDGDLSDRSGIDTLRQIRSHPDLDQNCVVMYLAKTSEIDSVLAFELGADNYF